MKVAAQASLRSAVGWQPTSFCQRALSPKTSAAAARLAVSYSPTDDELSDSLEPPIEAKPPVRVSSGRVRGVVIVPNRSDREFLYSVWVRILSFGPPLLSSPTIPVPPLELLVPPVALLPPPVALLPPLGCITPPVPAFDPPVLAHAREQSPKAAKRWCRRKTPIAALMITPAMPPRSRSCR